MPVRRQLGRPQRLAGQEPREDEVEQGGLGEHAARRHAEDGRRVEVGEPEQAATLSGDELVEAFKEQFNAEELLDDEPDEREAH